jgi:hypothetical protein
MNLGNFFHRDEAGLAQASRIADWTWEGASVVELRGKIADLYTQTPIFSRQPFRAGGEENRYKGEIRREPLKITEEPTPVATVSKGYGLIQHRDVLASVFRALRKTQINISEIDSTILMSEYGERLQWSCDIPNMDFDPGDGFPLVLRVNCLNSVDMSTALEIALSWYRLICSNGMMFGLSDSHLRRRHVPSLDPDDIAGYLGEQFKQVPVEKSLYQQWLKHCVQPAILAEWLDDRVAEEWGPHAAARVWHIALAGVDGEVQPAPKSKPHELKLNNSKKVPGCCAPVKNLYHVSQALSWIAGTRNNVRDRLECIKAIPQLMQSLAHHSGFDAR